MFKSFLLACVLCLAATGKGVSQSIASSTHHTCALSSAGALYCWGGSVLQPGNRIRSDSTPMPMLDSTRRFVGMAVGWLHVCALTPDGRVLCAGNSAQGQLGRNAFRTCGTCGLDTIESPLRFRSVVAGQSHSCALALDRRAYCWGANDAGQVGTGDRVPVIYWPTEVVGGHRWLSLVAGDHHTCGITTDERTLCWGSNSRGSLGYEQAKRKGCALPDRCMAVPYPVADTTRFAELFAGPFQTCGLTKAGQLNCWGGEFSDSLGHYWGIRDTIRPPVRLRAPFAIKSIALGYGSSCILAVGGDVYCILETNLGTVGGAGVTASRGTARVTDQPMNTPLRFLALSAYSGNACGIAADGGAYCWGKLDIPAEKLPCANPQSCTMLPYRVGGDLNLLKPPGAKR